MDFTKYKIAHEHQKQIWLAVMTGLVNCKSSALTTRPPSLPANMGPCHYEKVAPTYVPTLSDDGETHRCCINPPVSCSGHQISHKNLPLEFLFFWPQKEFRQISPKFKIHLILKLIVWFQEAFFIIRGTCKWLLSLTPNFLCLQQGGWANIGRGGVVARGRRKNSLHIWNLMRLTSISTSKEG